MGLYRKAAPDELGEAFGRSANKSELPANNSTEPANKSKRGRPIKQTGDPAKDKRNAEQRELMRKRRAAGK